jgi:hypothetical protein
LSRGGKGKILCFLISGEKEERSSSFLPLFQNRVVRAKVVLGGVERKVFN